MDEIGSRVWRVLLVDDHPLFREGLAAAVELDEEFTVVAQAARLPSRTSTGAFTAGSRSG